MARKQLEAHYWVTVNNAYIAIVKSETEGVITYEEDVYEAMTIKQIGLTPKNASLDIFASGKLFDSLNKNQGTDIAVDVIALPNWLIAKLQGSEQHKGGVIENTKDYPIKFAFGYSIETSGGGFHVAWCPLCKLQPPSKTTQTSTDSLTEPKETYAIKCIPTVSGDIDFEYDTRDAIKAGFKPLDIDKFFEKPISTKAQFTTLLDTAEEIQPQPPEEEEE